jgi:hypothetical protein
MVTCGLVTAHAADTTLTLACQGKETSRGNAGTSSEVINIGIIVDFQKKTVVGPEPTVPLTIDGLTETTVSFTRSEVGWHMSGTLDRVTGSLVAASIKSDPVTRKTLLSVSHDLQCRPAQRMF